MKQLLLSLLLCGSLNAFAQGSFLARPTKVFFNSEPAQQEKKTVEIRNTGDAPVLLELSLQDWVRDSIGNKLYSAPGAYPTSCGQYLKLSENTMLLQPGEARNLEISLTAPAQTLKHALNTMLMVTQSAEKKAEKTQAVAAQFNMQMRIGVHIYFQPPYLSERNVELQRLFFAKSGASSKDGLLEKDNGLVTEIKNLGQTIEEGKIKLELNNKKTGQTFSIEDKPFNSMPGDRLQIPFALPADLPKGAYAITAMLDTGLDAPLKVLEAEIEVQ